MAYSPITKASDFFNTKLWTGTGAENAITGVGFQPDWVWIKNRAAAENHKLYDAVRGATKNIYSNLTNAEGTDAQSLKSFDSDGFTLGTETVEFIEPSVLAEPEPLAFQFQPTIF